MGNCASHNFFKTSSTDQLLISSLTGTWMKIWKIICDPTVRMISWYSILSQLTRCHIFLQKCWYHHEIGYFFKNWSPQKIVDMPLLTWVMSTLSCVQENLTVLINSSWMPTFASCFSTTPLPSSSASYIERYDIANKIHSFSPKSLDFISDLKQ